MGKADDALRMAGAEALGEISEEEVKVPVKTGDLLGQAAESKKEVELTADEATERHAEKKARIAQIMDRGVLNERLSAIYDDGVPSGYKGKFIRDADESVIRYSNLGYTFNYREGAKGLHGTADNRIRVGDVVLMTISDEDLGILREVRQDAIRKKLGASRKEVANQAQRAAERGEGVPIFDDSNAAVRSTTPRDGVA